MYFQPQLSFSKPQYSSIKIMPGDRERNYYFEVTEWYEQWRPGYFQQALPTACHETVLKMKESKLWVEATSPLNASTAMNIII